MPKTHWLHVLAVEGWLPVFMDKDGEFCDESSAYTYEQWIVASEVYVYTVRNSPSDPWGLPAYIDGDDDTEIFNLEGLAEFIDGADYDAEIHPVLQEFINNNYEE